MRIILADHHEQNLWALETLLDDEPDLECAGEAIDAQELLALAEKHAPDLVLVDRYLPGESIEDLIASLGALKPRPIVMVMSSDLESGRVALRAGADAFISKGDQPGWLLDKLHKYARRVKNNILADKTRKGEKYARQTRGTAR